MGCLKLEDKSWELSVVYKKDTSPFGIALMAYMNYATKSGDFVERGNYGFYYIDASKKVISSFNLFNYP